MSIFSNFKINSLRKNVIEGNYDSRLERLALGLKDLPQDQRLELATKIGFSSQANSFAKILIFSLFHPDSGVFRNDIGNLNELTFDKLYEAMVVWYSWTRTPLNSEGEKPGLSFALDALETGLGIHPLIIKTYYDGLAGETYLVNFALYRWCMLAVGHVDSCYEALHENSPECKQFVATLAHAVEEADKYWDKK